VLFVFALHSSPFAAEFKAARGSLKPNALLQFIMLWLQPSQESGNIML